MFIDAEKAAEIDLEQTPSFTDYLAKKLGTRHWVLAQRLTDRLRRKGYELAISARHYDTLEKEFERETYGATLAGLENAAPDMLAALRAALPFLDSRAASSAIEMVKAAIEKAESSK